MLRECTFSDVIIMSMIVLKKRREGVSRKANNERKSKGEREREREREKHK